MLTQGKGGVRARERGGKTIIHSFSTGFLRTYAQGCSMWTVISSVSIVLSLLASLVAISLAARSAVAVQELRQAFQVLKRSDSKSFETRLDEYEKTLSLLANKLKMTKVRNAITHINRDSDGEPDAKSDPEAWRAWKNAQLRAGQFN